MHRPLRQVLESGTLKDTPREAAAALPTLLPFFVNGGPSYLERTRLERIPFRHAKSREVLFSECGPDREKPVSEKAVSRDLARTSRSSLGPARWHSCAFLAALRNDLTRKQTATARRRIDQIPRKSEFQIISGNQDQVQTHLDQLAGQNWRPILMTATNTSAGVTLFVILEGIKGGWGASERDI
jgi:hypothetical protein